MFEISFRKLEIIFVHKGKNFPLILNKQMNFLLKMFIKINNIVKKIET